MYCEQHERRGMNGWIDHATPQSTATTTAASAAGWKEQIYSSSRRCMMNLSMSRLHQACCFLVDSAHGLDVLIGRRCGYWSVSGHSCSVNNRTLWTSHCSVVSPIRRDDDCAHTIRRDNQPPRKNTKQSVSQSRGLVYHGCFSHSFGMHHWFALTLG